MKRIGVVGITGKVGTIVSNIVGQDPFFELVGGISSKSTDADVENIVKNSDVLIDFSLPIATMRVIPFAVQYGVPLVCGTTGFSKDDLQKMNRCSKEVPILYASNFSLAVQLMALLLKKCSETLGNDYDVSIIDKHHKNKKDAPSGTSLFLAEQLGRKAQMLSIRSGNIPAEIICDFCGDDEVLTISHRAFGRAVFAKGAVACAKWIIGKDAQMYSMQDYIGA